MRDINQPTFDFAPLSLSLYFGPVLTYMGRTILTISFTALIILLNSFRGGGGSGMRPAGKDCGGGEMALLTTQFTSSSSDSNV